MTDAVPSDSATTAAPTGSEVRSGLDRSGVSDSIRVQDDLFGHVNGAWLAEHEIPADRASDGEFRRLRDLAEERVRAIVEEAAEDPELADLLAAGDAPETDRGRVGLLYRLFMDEDAVEAAGAAPLAPMLEEVASTTSLADLVRLLASPVAGTSALHTYVWTDDDDSSRYQVKLHQGGLGLPDESYYREDSYAPIREAYVGHLARLADLASLPGREGLVAGDSSDLARAVMDFETRLAACHVDRVRLRDSEKSNNPMDATQREALAPAFPWDAYVEGTGAPAGAFDVVCVSQPEFVEAVAPLLAAEDLAVLRTWAALHTVGAFAPYLSSAFVEEDFDFSGRTLSGAEQLRERWKRGISLVEGAVGFAIGQDYVARHFPPHHKARMQELVGALLDAYRESISTLEWMTPGTREKALAKLELFTPKIAYPDVWRTYEGLVLDPHDLVASVRAARAHDAAHDFAKLAGPVDRDEWHMTPQTVNAYYNPGANEIVFPAAILEPPFFDAEAEDAVNFGGIGAVIGHEIGHGFDDQGSKYDGEGNLRSWWTDEDREAFEQRTRALIDQFDALTPRVLREQAEATATDAADGGDAVGAVGADGGDGAVIGGDELPHVNGSLTIGENIGDLGGLTIAIKAYLARSGGNPPRLDDLSGLQRVFWSWATVWRAKSRAQDAARMLAIDPHSPAEFRCNAIASNLDAFHAAFDVREDDAMYRAPEDRVSIW
ncbi:M13 family metallopeptidase [Brachybacterium kimchii]|uniref:Peptidase M13 n=1 Tax=Brachybacterium kimchii TaxID=2942909 RepID=A0ABY4N9D0_9MICO|nr:M13-type metalloendopeptidase [Brachybacterium kimchii]UQN31154.1 peptidase M13 [Brachybacterium kimchii]